MGLFGGGAQTGGGYSSTTIVDGKLVQHDIGRTASSTTASTASKAMGYANVAFSAAQAGMNISSYSSQAKQYGKQAANAFSNMLAIEDNYDLNKWILRQKAVKTYGGIKVRIGEGGSGLDMLQESAKNVGIEQYKMHEQYLMEKYQAYKDYRKQKTKQAEARSGEIGAAIGQAASIALSVGVGIMTGNPAAGYATYNATSGMFTEAGGKMGVALR